MIDFMKLRSFFVLSLRWSQLVFLAMLLVPDVSADVEIRLSVKFIKDLNGNNPMPAPTWESDISDPIKFEVEVAHGNAALARRRRGITMRVVEYLYIQPPVPGGQAADYWYNIDARANAGTIEDAADLDPIAWKWNNTAVNIFVNNSRSGQCSFPEQGKTISLGAGIGRGTVIHELGHFFSLRHTHPLDNDGKLENWGDGDGLPETLTDEADASVTDAQAYHAGQPASLINDLVNNIMSYHNENELLPIQMDLLSTSANTSRSSYVTAHTIFVATTGETFYSGLAADRPLKTMNLAKNRLIISPAQSVILISPGTYHESVTFDKACTLRPKSGPVTIVGQ